MTRTIQQVARDAEYAELAGESARIVYQTAIRQIGAEIRERYGMLCELRGLRDHRHEFPKVEESERCLCIYCGADGDA